MTEYFTTTEFEPQFARLTDGDLEKIQRMIEQSSDAGLKRRVEQLTEQLREAQAQTEMMRQKYHRFLNILDYVRVCARYPAGGVNGVYAILFTQEQLDALK